jgi:DNA repair exonuclease SbcCD nuclease subunit
MKIAILGDTHIGARNDSAIFHDHFERFYSNVFFPYLEQHNIQHVLQLGDLFDRRKYINFQTLKRARGYLLDKLNNYTTYVLVGNHDTYYKNTNEVNSIELLLDGYDNIIAVNGPMEVNFDTVTFLLTPWISDQNQTETLNAIQSTRASVVAGHFEIRGFEMQRGMLNDEGLEPEAFSNVELVISGHFHHKSVNRNIQYLGTPYELTWSDYDDPKGFHIYDTDTRELTFVPNPDQMFFKLFYNDQGQSVDYYKQQDVSMLGGKIVKVIIKTKDNPICFDRYIERLEKAGVADLQVVEDHLNLDLEGDDDIVSEAEDTITILRKYIEQVDVAVDRKKLNKLMQDLYTEALTVE